MLNITESYSEIRSKTMKARILYYKAKWGDGHKVDNLIAVYSKLFNWNTPPYSHVELWIPNDQGNFLNYDRNDTNILKVGYYGKKSEFVGQCFTSSMRSAMGIKSRNGTCIRPASDILKHPDRWDYQEIELTDKQYSDLLETIDVLVKSNAGYDEKAIISFFNPFGRWPRSSAMGICTEVVWYALVMIDVLKCIKVFTPRRFSRRIRKFMVDPSKLGKIKPLK